MLEAYCIVNDFNKCIEEAIKNLKINKFNISLEYIYEAIILDASSSKPHNLLGIIYEKQGDLDLARRHYRASYSLDQSYKPASINLERVCKYDMYLMKMK